MKKTNIFCLIIALLAGLVTFSCDNNLTVKDNKTYISINTNIAAARTVITDEAFIEDLSELHDFTFDCKYCNSDQSILSKTWESYEDFKDAGKMEIDVINYPLDFVLTARSENGVLYRDVKEDIKIVSGDNQITFNLKLYKLSQEATGGVDFTLYFPSEVNGYTFELKKDRYGEAVDCSDYITFGNGEGDYAEKKYIRYKQDDLTSANYILYVKLYADEDKNIQVCDYEEAVSVADNITCKAVRETAISVYKIEYEWDGGEIEAGSTAPYCYPRYYFGVISLPEAVKYGYTFGGWYTDPEFSEGSRVWRINGDNYGDIKLYAKFVKKYVWFYINVYVQDLDNEDNYTYYSRYYSESGYYGDVYTEEIKAPTGFTRKADQIITVPGTTGEEIPVYFTRNSYSLTFDFDDGSEPVTITDKYEAEVTIPEAPEIEGKYLNNWTLDGEYVWSSELPKTMPAEDRIYVAEWRNSYYYLNFDTDGGSSVSSQYLTFGEKTTVPENPTKTGYTFEKWEPEIPETMPSSELTVKAIWKANQYTITFDTQGGPEMEPLTLDYGAKIPEIENPEKKGYIFYRWTGRMESDTSTRYDVFPETMPAENLYFTALWNVGSSSYKVEYYLQNIDDDEYTLFETEDKTGTTNGETNGWGYYSKSYTGFKWFSYSGEKTIEADDSTVVQNYYNRNKYTLTVKNADGTTTEIEYKYQAEITPLEDQSKTGYVFAGWNPSVPETMPANDVTVEPVFTNATDTAYTVRHYVQGADSIYVLDEEELLTGTTGEETNAVIKDYGIGFTSPESVYQRTIAADGSTIVYIYYSRNTYTLTYDYNYENASSKTVSYLYEADISEYTTERTGYVFDGWSLSTENQEAVTLAKMPAEDKILYAIWLPATDTGYSLRYYLESLSTSGTCVDGIYYEQKYNNEYINWESFYGTTGELTNPVVGTYEGFTLKNVEQKTIAADGSTLINAYFTRNSYTITFDTDGGSEIAPINLKYGEKVYEKTEDLYTDKEGYTLNYWNITGENGTSYSHYLSLMPAENVTFKAEWTPAEVEYTVEYYYETETVGEYELYNHTYKKKGYTGSTTEYVPTSSDSYSSAHYTLKSVEQQVIKADGSTVVEVYYDRNQYTITFNTNGGSELEPITVRSGCKIIGETVPVKQGYTLMEWTFIDDSGDKLYRYASDGFWEKPIREYDITVDIVWKAVLTPYTVNYWLQDLDDETKYTLMYTVSETGYTGDKTSGSLHYYIGTVVDSDIQTIAADGSTVRNIKFNRKNVTVRFRNDYIYNLYNGSNTYINGGEHYELLYVSTGKNGAPLDKPADPVREGYTFTGWSTDWSTRCGLDPDTYPLFTNYYEAYDSVDEVNCNEIYKATWEPAEVNYTVNYYTPDLNASTYTLYKSEIKKGTSDTEVTVEPIEIEGFSYDRTQSDYVKPDGSTVFGFHYTRNSNTMTFLKEDSSTYTTREYYYGQTGLTISSTPTKQGYTFKEWSPAIPETYPGEDMTFTPVFTPNTDTSYIVYYYVENADGTFTKENGYDCKKGTTDAVAEANPEERAGFTAEYESKTIAADGSTIVEVYYKRNTITVSFITNCDTAIEPITQKTFTSIAALPELSKAGYTFSKWTPDYTGHTPAVSTTYTAVWTANTDTAYTVEHYLQNIDDDDFTIVSEDTENKTGTTDTDTEAIANTYEGFTAQTFTQKNIDGDGSAVVKIYYTRNQYTITFDTAGGSSIAAITKKHGASVTAPADPSRDGYLFMGWDKEIPTTMPMEDMTITASWKKATLSLVTLVQSDVKITAEGMKLTADAGYSLYKWYVDGKLVQKGTENIYRLTKTVKGSYKVMVIAFDSKDNPYSTTVQVNVQ